MFEELSDLLEEDCLIPESKLRSSHHEPTKRYSTLGMDKEICAEHNKS